MITIQQINQFREQAKKMGKSDAEIDSFINQKLNSQQQTPFSPRPQVISTPTSSTPTTSQAPVTVGQKITTGVEQGLNQAGQSAVGAGKGILSTLNNISQLGQKFLGKVTGINAPVTSLPTNVTTPTQAQKPAFVGEQIGEFFAPSGATTNLTKSLDIAADGLKVSKLAQGAIKAGGRAAIEGGAAAAVRLGQTANAKQAAVAGVTAGGLAGATSAAGQALKAARIPEWFYSKIFHTSYDDMLQELKTVGTANLKQTNPYLYNKLVYTGVIKIDNAGKTVLNETLAKEALDRGLKGSIKNMANQVVKNTYELEDTAQTLTKSHSALIKVEPQYTKLLQEVGGDYEAVGFGEVSKEANDLLSKIQDGQTDAETALRLRRFLDGMRVRASFNPTGKLSQTQQNFKYLADTMRQRLATEVPGLKPVMNEYRFNIEALNALAKEAAKRGNKDVVGLLDTVFFGSGVATGNPAAGAALGLTRRIVNSPAGTTKIGQALNKLGTGTAKGAILRGAAAYGASTTRSNQPKPFQPRK